MNKMMEKLNNLLLIDKIKKLLQVVSEEEDYNENSLLKSLNTLINFMVITEESYIPMSLTVVNNLFYLDYVDNNINLTIKFLIDDKVNYVVNNIHTLYKYEVGTSSIEELINMLNKIREEK